MKSVEIKILKNRLSEYVGVATAGETVLVTERGRVVAELVPPRSDQFPRFSNALLNDLILQGLLTPPTLNRVPLPPRHPIAPLHQILVEFDSIRRDR